jgi:hypothetical protein
MSIRSRSRQLSILAACGTAVALGAAAAAQPYQINVAGATLLENLFTAPAITNDFIDINGNGIAGSVNSVNEQLATAGLPPTSFLVVNYMAIGSVNGFQELVDWGSTFNTLPGSGPAVNALPRRQYIPVIARERAFWNRTQYINAGVISNAAFGSIDNPGGIITRQNPTTYQAVYTGGAVPAPNGYINDIAPVDVPAPWAVRAAGSVALTRNPAEPGYGSNPVLAVTKQGITFVDPVTLQTFGNQLASLNAIDGVTVRNTNTASPDANTIFDTAVAFAPIAPMANLGVGRSQIDMSDIRHLFATGRIKSGENLMAITRDSGSGTRNAFNNTTGCDPSWGRGENIGGLSSLSDNNLAGPGFQPSNKAGNGGVEATVPNNRLAIGYVGAERGVVGGWLTGGRAEFLAVRNDLQGGTVYSRPNIDAVLDNSPNGFTIGGPAVLSTLGDPRSSVPAPGFTQPAVGHDPGNLNPPMRNPYAAALINNITISLAAVQSAPGSDPTVFSPGELIAFRFIPVAGLDFIHSPTQPLQMIPNPSLNQVVQDYVRANNVLANPVYYAFGTVTLNGITPTRRASTTYTDGNTGNHFVRQDGSTIAYASPLNSRNRVAGDFNGDGLRDLRDAENLLRAWRQRNGGPVWVAPNGTGPIAGAPGSEASIEILGDFDGDGNFTTADVRYWADGLAMEWTGPNAGNLNRKKGFEAIDTAWVTLTSGASNNFFGTKLKTNKTYQPGFSRGDVANVSQRVTPGFAPIGAVSDPDTNPLTTNNNIIDGYDIDYVYAQFKRNPAVTDNEATWSDINEAPSFDLSADINGDLVVNQADVDELVLVILQTSYGDVNLDGVVDAADLSIAQGNLGQPGGWADGDINGDGLVTQADIDIILAAIGTPACNSADIAATDSTPGADGCVDNGDFSLFISAFFNANCDGTTIPCNPADIAATDSTPGADGSVDNGDFSLFISAFFNAVCPDCGN